MIEKPASGVDIPEMFRIGSAEPDVEFGEDRSFHCPGGPGPNSSHYEDAQERCGAHLVFKVSRMISNFCVHQMLMCNGIHAVDLGIIITLIGAILRAFQVLEIVDSVLYRQEMRAMEMRLIGSYTSDPAISPGRTQHARHTMSTQTEVSH